MQSTNFINYTIGQDAFNQISNICSIYGKNLQLIGGEKALNSSIDKLKDALKDTDMKLLDPLFYGGECTYENMNSLYKKIKNSRADIIAGVGGGKAIDTAKGVAHMLNLPCITIPTIASTCASATKLSVVYDKNHKFIEFMFFDNPPVHSFIDSEIIAKAPVEYFRAGMGDTLAKHYECTFAARGEKLNFTSGLGVSISKMCAQPIFLYGLKALRDCEEGIVTPELEQIIQSNIIATGLVSILVDEDYNGALAHSLFYGLTLLPHIEEKYLHGDVVAFGILVQLMIDKDLDEALKVRSFLKELGCPVSLKEIEVELNRESLSEVLTETVTGPDMNKIPYKIDEDMVFEALIELEKI